MSRFDAAVAKAGAKAGAKAAAKSTPSSSSGLAANASAKATVVKKALVLKTLADKKAFVLAHEVKLDDAQCALENETNKPQRKKLENNLKTLRADEDYQRILTEIKEEEAQAARDRERAAVHGPQPGLAEAKSKAADTGKKENVSASGGGEAVTEDAMAEIDSALAGTGKDAAAAKAAAVARLEAIAGCTPFVLRRVEKLVPLFGDSKLGQPSIKAACAIVTQAQPRGHGVASVVIPALLTGMDSKTWKIKAGCIQVMVPCLPAMAQGTPAQLAECLPVIVGRLATAATMEVRKEIRDAVVEVLRQVGNMVASPEIQKLSADLVTALAEPTNQKHTQSVLERMGNQTFLSLIDAASLSLLMPVVIRGMKEKHSMSKKWSAQIFGSTAILLKNIETIQPYVETVVPLLKDALADTVPEVQREAAKAFGILEQVLPEYSRMHLQPWLFGRLRGSEAADQKSAAQALAQTLSKMKGNLLSELLPEIEAGCKDADHTVRNGFMELMDAAPQAMKMDFVPFLERLFPAMMLAITGGAGSEDTGLRAASAIVARFGDLCPHLLLPAFEAVLAETLPAETDREDRHSAIREKSVQLLGGVADKILEHKKFGENLLTTNECSTKEVREHILCLVLAMRSDRDAAVKRAVGNTWKAAGGAPKLQKAIMPAAEKLLLRWRAGDLGAGAQYLAGEAIAELAKSGDLQAPEGEAPATAERFMLPPARGRTEGSAAAAIVSGHATAVPRESGEEQGDAALGLGDVEKKLAEYPEFASQPKDVCAYCGLLASSVISEGRKHKKSGARIAQALATDLGTALASVSNAPSNDGLAKIADAACRSLLGEAYDNTETGDHSDDNEALLSVDDLLLCYGAGHLLLKGTKLEMRKNHRYGVVGQNGAGKTTLMKEIAAHRIVGMPKELKCVHVDDSKLGLMSSSCLTCLEYVIKMAREIGVMDAGKDTLLGVGFPEEMMDDPVADLSTGWRMRLTLAVSMLKHADLVLLDEPTNHLDEESVEWLGDYILSIKESSVMVISHSPKFMNQWCTDVIAYVDRTLEYTHGNFDTFAAKKGLNQEQIHQMLSGNLSFDTQAEGDESGSGDDRVASKEPKAVECVARPAKLSFPIPGSMEGVKSGTRAVLEAKHLSFRWSKEKDDLISDANVKLSLGSRVAICGRNGCGKSTLMTLLCSQMSPSENKDASMGEVIRHCNLRLGYMAQDHLSFLAPFFDTSPYVYITSRFKDGYDGDLQRKLIEPADAEEAERRAQLAKQHGKYGNQVAELVTRTTVGKQAAYEVRWEGLDDPKQNTVVTVSKLREMGLAKVVIACDERIAAKAAGMDQRPLTRREVVKHVEAFGIDEEMCCNRQIRGFSAGQKVRLSLAAMFWTKPHLIALDEPTNYLDVETVEALAKALSTFRGGILMIEPKTEFVDRLCNEKWWLENGQVTVEKLNNNVKRVA